MPRSARVGAARPSAAVRERRTGAGGRSARPVLSPGPASSSSRRWRHAGLPRIDEIGIDPVVLVFTLAISILTGLLFGLIPVMRFGTPSVVALKDGGRSASDAPGRHRARNALVVSEIALALVLLIVSGLMIRTFIALRQVDPGFVRPAEVQTFRALDSRGAHQGSATVRSGLRADRLSAWNRYLVLSRWVSRRPSRWMATQRQYSDFCRGLS